MNMRRAGASESVVMRVMGHNSRKMFDRYDTVEQTVAKAKKQGLQIVRNPLIFMVGTGRFELPTSTVSG